MKKYVRQTKILEIIEENEIETQEELADLLKKQGIEVTQATISRDIRELGIVKVMTNNGNYKYATLKQKHDCITERLITIFKNSITSMEIAGNILVLKTLPGAAQIAGSAIDSMNVNNIVGTIAGDDTIFVAVNRTEKTIEVLEFFQNLIE
ncbi:ArgR family transcriptional regulator [Caloranaerobacter sp. TR13]|uniref:arginine repressor n=1 Tax=Caloranaerobacter sp. TR13 TaxID=1302151 RepID=UPI0006D48888|nr:arginine repressor [Caloranaerobacter sp. TR13]KPU28099.1 ArgR family transcriptional regulator [Caloranaerobacter sp. TR13]